MKTFERIKLLQDIIAHLKIEQEKFGKFIDDPYRTNYCGRTLSTVSMQLALEQKISDLECMIVSILMEEATTAILVNQLMEEMK